jgi:hypothetical protein
MIRDWVEAACNLGPLIWHTYSQPKIRLMMALLAVGHLVFVAAKLYRTSLFDLLTSRPLSRKFAQEELSRPL